MAGELIYNRVQERATRRQTEQAFGSRHADVLLEAPMERREPTLESAPPASPPHIPSAAGDPRIDYVVEVRGAAAATLQAHWSGIERRFGRRAGLSESGGAVHATFQMVSRNGVAGEAELLEFRTEVETLAVAHGAAVSAPPMREALDAAQALDRACADVDVQIALHVLGPVEVELRGGEGFSVARREGGVTLLLDVPRTPDLGGSYAAMTRAARRLGGRVVDDNGNALDERALGAIGAEVEALRMRLGEIGIEPGSPLALRLFS